MSRKGCALSTAMFARRKTLRMTLHEASLFESLLESRQIGRKRFERDYSTFDVFLAEAGSHPSQVRGTPAEADLWLRCANPVRQGCSCCEEAESKLKWRQPHVEGPLPPKRAEFCKQKQFFEEEQRQKPCSEEEIRSEVEVEKTADQRLKIDEEIRSEVEERRV